MNKRFHRTNGRRKTTKAMQAMSDWAAQNMATLARIEAEMKAKAATGK